MAKKRKGKSFSGSGTGRKKKSKKKSRALVLYRMSLVISTVLTTVAIDIYSARVVNLETRIIILQTLVLIAFMAYKYKYPSEKELARFK